MSRQEVHSPILIQTGSARPRQVTPRARGAEARRQRAGGRAGGRGGRGQKAGLPFRRYHATRHTYATWLLADGADLRWVQQQMGHASIGQTADTYGHVQPDRHEAASAGLDRCLA